MEAPGRPASPRLFLRFCFPEIVSQQLRGNRAHSPILFDCLNFDLRDKIRFQSQVENFFCVHARDYIPMCLCVKRNRPLLLTRADVPLDPGSERVRVAVAPRVRGSASQKSKSRCSCSGRAIGSRSSSYHPPFCARRKAPAPHAALAILIVGVGGFRRALPPRERRGLGGSRRQGSSPSTQF